LTGTKGGRRAWTMDPPFRDSQLVRPAGAEVTVDQVGRPHRRGIGDRGSPWLAATLSALDGRLAHQALDVVATDRLPGPEHRLPRASVATGLVVGGVDLADAAEQPLVVNGPGRAPASGALAQASSSGTRPREPRKRLRANGVREPFGTRAWYPLRFQPRAQRWRSTKKCSPLQAALGAGATGLEPATSGVTETPRSADPGGMRVANAGIVRLGRFDQARWVPIWCHARDALGEGRADRSTSACDAFATNLVGLGLVAAGTTRGRTEGPSACRDRHAVRPTRRRRTWRRARAPQPRGAVGRGWT
jgi:hypothetical protein